jgi:hypothetical protein
MIDLSAALLSLRPSATWSLVGDDYATLDWPNQATEKPSESECRAEMQRLQQHADATEYQRKRAAEYPDMRDYLDAVVKDDTDQLQRYIAGCLAVKARYPKPE